MKTTKPLVSVVCDFRLQFMRQHEAVVVSGHLAWCLSMGTKSISTDHQLETSLHCNGVSSTNTRMQCMHVESACTAIEIRTIGEPLTNTQKGWRKAEQKNLTSEQTSRKFVQLYFKKTSTHELAKLFLSFPCFCHPRRRCATEAMVMNGNQVSWPLILRQFPSDS